MSNVGLGSVFDGSGDDTNANDGWEAVDSSRFRAMKFDADENKLSIRWKDGSVGHYLGVTQEDYEALRIADSVGKHLGQFIIPRFEYRKGER